MIGAILGDVIGSPYEFDMGDKTKNFPLFSKYSTFTDDSVMSIAVAQAFMAGISLEDEEAIKAMLTDQMRAFGREYPDAGYGGRFRHWLSSKDPQPYNSYGNGSAMRVSSVAWLYDNIEDVRKAARLSAEVTHNHPEGIKGAEATASAIFLARTDHSKSEIKAYIENHFGYNLDRTCDEIRPVYHHVESCMETVPEAITAFLEGECFEDVIRTAVSLGGDCDTLTAIAGSIAEGFYGVPEALKTTCYDYLPPKLLGIVKAFEKRIKANYNGSVKMNVQSYISNISFPTTLEELYEFAGLFNMEMILGCSQFDDYGSNISRYNSWTAPKWIKKDDIVFFMHAKYANQKIRALQVKLLANRDNYDNEDFWIMMNALIRAKAIHQQFGGKIFAVARVCGNPEFIQDENAETLHWKSNVYANLKDIFLLEEPIDISEFNSEIKVSRQSSITPLFGSEFDYLKNLILSKNKIVERYLMEAEAEPTPLVKISEHNWIEIGNKFRRSFFLEIQFRNYYVDYLLKALGDIKTIYKECLCNNPHYPNSYVDNVIKFNEKYLPVEVKLSVPSEKNIVGQVQKYCHLTELWLTKDKIINKNIYENKVLIIDTNKVYMYDDLQKKCAVIFDLDQIKTDAEISLLRNIIIENL